jgi:hypothetical protein
MKAVDELNAKLVVEKEGDVNGMSLCMARLTMETVKAVCMDTTG